MIPVHLRQRIRRLGRSVAARGAGTVFITQASGAGLVLLVHVLLARWAGPAEYGLYSYALAWASLLSIGVGVGFPEAALRFVPTYETKRDWPHLQGLVQRGERLTLLISLSLVAIATAGFSLFREVAPGTTPQALLIGLWILPLVALIRLYTEICRALDRIVAAYVVPRLLRPPLLIGGLTLVVYLPNMSLTGPAALAVFGGASLPILLLQRRTFRRYLRETEAPSRYETNRWLSVALPLLLVTGFTTVIQQTDLLLIGWMLDLEAAGLYKAATAVATPVGFVLSAVNAVAAPRFARFYADDAHQRLRRFVARLAHGLFWPTLGIALVIAIGADFFLGLFGPRFTAAREPLLILILSHLINAGAGSVGYLLNMTGHHLDSARVYGLTALLNLGANALGIYLFGLIGAAAATTLAMLVWNAWLHRIVTRRLSLTPSIVSVLRSSG